MVFRVCVNWLNWHLSFSSSLLLQDSQGWWELVFWMMLLRACTTLRSVGSDRWWLGHRQKWSSNSFLLCRSTVSTLINFSSLLKMLPNLYSYWIVLQDILASLNMLMITELVKSSLSWMGGWTNVVLLVLALILVLKKSSRGLQDCFLHVRSVAYP